MRRFATLCAALLAAISVSWALLTLKASGRADQVMQIVAAELGASGPKWMRHERWRELSSKHISVNFRGVRAWDACQKLSGLLGCRVFLRDGELYVDSLWPADEPPPHARAGDYDITIEPQAAAYLIVGGKKKPMALRAEVPVILTAADRTAALRLLGWAPRSVRVRLPSRNQPLPAKVLMSFDSEDAPDPFISGGNIIAPLFIFSFPDEMLTSEKLILEGTLVVHSKPAIEARFDPPRKGARIEVGGVTFTLTEFNGTAAGAVVTVRHSGQEPGYIRVRWVDKYGRENQFERSEVREYGDGKLLRRAALPSATVFGAGGPVAVIVRYWSYTPALNMVRVHIAFTLSDVAARYPPKYEKPKVKPLTVAELQKRRPPWERAPQPSKPGHLVTLHFVGTAADAIAEACQQAGVRCPTVDQIQYARKLGTYTTGGLEGLKRAVKVDVRDVPLFDALKVIGDQAGLRFTAAHLGVTVIDGQRCRYAGVAKLGSYRLVLTQVARIGANVSVRGTLWCPYASPDTKLVNLRDWKLEAAGKCYSASVARADPSGPIAHSVFALFANAPAAPRATLCGSVEIVEAKPARVTFKPTEEGATKAVGKARVTLDLWDPDTGVVAVTVAGTPRETPSRSRVILVAEDGTQYAPHLEKFIVRYPRGKSTATHGHSTPNPWQRGINIKTIIVELAGINAKSRHRHSFTLSVPVIELKR